MLSLTSEFTQHDIHTVRVYKGGVVYLLQGNGDDIVVKNENITQNDVKHFDLSKKAMGAVDRNVKSSKKLTDNEINALIGYVLRQKSLVQFRLKDRLPGAADDLDEALSKLRDPARKNVWYKMPHLKMMNMQSALETQLGATEGDRYRESEAVPQSDKPMREFLKVLKASGGLESLGKVIAIDIFSGNNDRIIPDGGRRAIIGKGYDQRFITFVNIGNLMIVGEGKARTISGMDFADPASIFRNAQDSLENQTIGGTFYGEDIVDPAKRHQFAKNVVSDLELLFRAGKKKGIKDYLPGGALGSNATKRLEKGMVEGAKMLTGMVRTKMQTKLKVYPKSFLDRVKIYEGIA